MSAHDADAAELTDLLAPNNSSEDNVMPEGDVQEVSKYLTNEYHISPQGLKDAVRGTEHQQHIDSDSGAAGLDTLTDLNSDPLENMNHDMFIEAAPVPAPLDTCVEVKQEYSETISAPSVQSTPNVSTVTAKATDVESTIGSVKVQ